MKKITIHDLPILDQILKSITILIKYFLRSSGRSMKQSWEFLIARQYNYQFENFYATVIQRAYRNYKKRPESLAKRVWEAVRNDGTPDNMKFLRGIPTREYWDFGSNDLELISEKRVQLRLRLINIASIVALKLLYQQGYIIIKSSIWEVN